MFSSLWRLDIAFMQNYGNLHIKKEYKRITFSDYMGADFLVMNIPTK